ncbi:unnamed protein product [Meganyctiphanes norvegica]|uniref:Uncharacterized protein n=1 Tax=Meganyctiphanes norvegica TaxID=48144 RepID=A0AAV2QEX8_MEGNR
MLMQLKHKNLLKNKKSDKRYSKSRNQLTNLKRLENIWKPSTTQRLLITLMPEPLKLVACATSIMTMNLKEEVHLQKNFHHCRALYKKILLHSRKQHIPITRYQYQKRHQQSQRLPPPLEDLIQR